MNNKTNSEWYSIKWDIELDIINGVYKAGDKLPSIVEIMEKYQVSKGTVQKVLRALSDDNIVMCISLKGTFVKPFVRERLLKERKELLRKEFEDLRSRAERIGLTLKDICESPAD